MENLEKNKFAAFMIGSNILHVVSYLGIVFLRYGVGSLFLVELPDYLWSICGGNV